MSEKLSVQSKQNAKSFQTHATHKKGPNLLSKPVYELFEIRFHTRCETKKPQNFSLVFVFFSRIALTFLMVNSYLK